MRSAAIALAVLALATAAPAAEKALPVTATLVLPYARILPGVPFDLVVRLHNTSHQTATVGLLASLHVRDVNGSVLLAPWEPVGRQYERNIGQLEPYRDSYVVLAPGESVERVVDWQYGIQNWHSYPQISAPGTYELSLELASGRRLYEDAVNVIEKLRTTTVRLERVVPQGEDEELWRRMQDASNGQWDDMDFQAKTGFKLAEEIVREHPESAYYPYALIITGKPIPRKDDIPLLVEAAGRFVDSPAHAHLLKRAADIEVVEAHLARHVRNDHAEAERHHTLADQYYRQALKTKNAAIRPAAEDRLRFTERERATLRLREKD